MVRLSRRVDDTWIEVAALTTDEDGRLKNLPGDRVALTSGRYRLHFETGEYFRGQGMNAFHPYVEIVCEITDPSQNYHVPLLLTPFSHSTYRGT